MVKKKKPLARAHDVLVILIYSQQLAFTWRFHPPVPFQKQCLLPGTPAFIQKIQLKPRLLRDLP